MSDEQDQKREVYLYDLTPMTGKDAQKDRRAVHFTIEMSRSTRNAHLIAIPVALAVLGVAVVAMRLLPVIPLWVTVIPAAVAYIAVLFMALARQRRGLRLAQWRAFVDRKRARTGVFIQCGAVIDPLSSTPMRIVRSGVPNDSDPSWDTDLILDEVTA